MPVTSKQKGCFSANVRNPHPSLAMYSLMKTKQRAASLYGKELNGVSWAHKNEKGRGGEKRGGGGPNFDRRVDCWS